MALENLCHHDDWRDTFVACEVKYVLYVSSFNTEKEVWLKKEMW